MPDTPPPSSRPSTSPRPRPPAPGARRAPTNPVKIPSGPPWRKLAPYIGAAAAVVLLIVLMRSPGLANVGAFLIGVVVTAALGYVGVSYRINLPPSDRMRVLLPMVTVVVLLSALIPYGYTLFPPPPRGAVTLRALGDAGAVDVASSGSSVWLSVEGRFVHGATGEASYFLTVTRDGGGHEERITGAFRPHAGAPEPDRHVIEQRGPGHFTIRLEQAADAVALPLRVSVNTRPFSTLTLIALYAALAAAILAVDTMLWRRGVEPSYASAMLLPLVAVVYFQRTPVAPDTLRTSLIASGVIGAVGGGLGGEVLARVVRMVVPK